MLSLRKTIASLTRSREKWEELKRDAGVLRAPGADAPGARLQEIRDFGSNPGHLRMFGYRPVRLAADPALVVVLHGCTQTAAGYDLLSRVCVLLRMAKERQSSIDGSGA